MSLAPPRLSRRAIAAICLAVACADNTGPPGELGIELLAGNGQTDTVTAELSQALVVHIPGAPAGVIVRFESLPFDSARPQPGAFVGRLTSPTYGTFVVDSLDQRGRVAVLIKLGSITGTARIHVAVPELDLQDTASFTVTPGRAAGIAAFPPDTALLPARFFQARGAVTDRWGNPRPDPVTYALLSGPIAVTGPGVITSTSVGRGSYVVSSGTVSDTGYVSVVPSGEIVAVRMVFGTPTALVRFVLDGSGLQTLTLLPNLGWEDPNPRWTPDGTRVVYSAGDGDQSRLYTVTLAGATARLIASPPAELVSEIWPFFARDGATVYFSGRTGSTNYMVWRAASDGTGAVRLSPDSVLGSIEWRQTPSPDGSRLAYIGDGGGGAVVKVKYFMGDSTSTWSTQGQTPRWSPAGDQIAFVSQFGGPLFVINADGTGLRQISMVGRNYDERAFDWSPDGQWIVAAAASTGRLDLIRVASGQTLPLEFAQGLTMPSWRP